MKRSLLGGSTTPHVLPPRRRGPRYPGHELSENEFASSGAKQERSDSHQARLRRLFPQPVLDDLALPWWDMTRWHEWARKRENLWNRVDSGRHQGGYQRPDANYIGALGEALWHELTGLPLRETCDPAGLRGADFTDGTDVKATASWSDPWLRIPRTMELAPWFALVALDMYGLAPVARSVIEYRRIAGTNPRNQAPLGFPEAALVWRITREQMIESASWWEKQDAQRFVFPYKNNVAHFCINWRSFPVAGTGYDPPGRVNAPAPKHEKPPEGITQPPRVQYNAREAVVEMRRILGTKEEP